MGSNIRTLCTRKGRKSIEAAGVPGHIHLYVSIPPEIQHSATKGYLKGKSSLMIFKRQASLKYKYGNEILCRYGRKEKTIRE